MSVDAYRERHGLPATLALVAPDLAETWRQQTKDRHARGEIRGRVVDQEPAEQAAASRDGNARHSETARRPGVRAAHQRGIVKGRTQAHENKRATLRDLAVSLGYADWSDLITRTRHQSMQTVAEKVGRDPKTITYWRRKILGDDWVTAGGRLQPRKAAAYARLDEAFARLGWATLADALAAQGKAGLRGVARAVGSTPRVLRGWEDHRRGV